MGGVFTEFRGGAGAWTKKSPGWSQIPLLGAIPLDYCAWGKLHPLVLGRRCRSSTAKR